MRTNEATDAHAAQACSAISSVYSMDDKVNWAVTGAAQRLRDTHYQLSAGSLTRRLVELWPLPPMAAPSGMAACRTR